MNGLYSRLGLTSRAMGITARTALLCWLVSTVTLLIFVIVIIPLQKRNFLENLESKAHGVAVSLHEVAAGAAVNEDFSSVVDHCKEMLRGDRNLDYLVITKNDGFSLINDHAGWRAEPNTSIEWRPARRETFSGIDVVPLFNRRVFHYSQPFDYSGMEWGWIHVGLSLSSYDRSVSTVHRRTWVLAIVCIGFSLAASVLYAKRLVRPILALQAVVQRVASGDLSARAPVDRGDELGSLAGSVNSMTEALLRRDKILQSVQFAAEQFLSTPNWKEVVERVLAKVGEAAQAGRVYVFENHLFEDSSGFYTSLQYEWTAPSVPSQMQNPAYQHFEWQSRDLSHWLDQLSRGETVSASIAEMSAKELEFFGRQNVKSLIFIPITVEGVWWGALGLEEHQYEREWTTAERDSLRAAADMLGAALARQRMQDELMEAKDTLEQRVSERTRELQEQVTAKERARAELADAQQKLIEASRQAGMAEVATGVLHNVGNVLNSVNVSTTLVREHLHRSEIPTLIRVAALLEENASNIGAFLTGHPKGRMVPAFIIKLAGHLQEEHAGLLKELDQLSRNVEHVKEIVAMQQSYARVSGFVEKVSLASLLDDALQMNLAGMSDKGIEVVRQYSAVPELMIDKHKVMQILINLVRNASYALETADCPHKQLTVGIGLQGDKRVRIVVADNGVGIAPENLTRIFSHGFTTRKDGHGFGLHSGANAAKEMGGLLKANSDGPGKGATFILELPLIDIRARGA